MSRWSMPRANSEDLRLGLYLTGANAAIAACIVVLQLFYGIATFDLVRDPNAIARQPSYFGAISNLSVLVWAVGASVALFAASLLGGADALAFRQMLLVGGGYMAIACIDDLYMLHENAHVVGLHENVVLLLHAGLFGVFLLCVARVWRETAWPLLAICVLCMTGTVAADVLPTMVVGQVLLEETLKLGAISFLTAFVAASSLRAVRFRTSVETSQDATALASDILLDRHHHEAQFAVRRSE